MKDSQPKFEKITYEDPNKDEFIVEIYKNADYEKTVPRILAAINSSKNDKTYGDYPYFRKESSISYLPKLNIPSDILSNDQLKELHAHLPYFHQYTNLKRIFSLSIDGCALKTFYDKCEDINNSILVIKDDEGNVFGAYASESFAPIMDFKGTGECFLFSFYKGKKIHVFNATGLNNYFMYCGNDQINFGCSDDYFSLSLGENFLNGYSKTTQTYNNAPLSEKEQFMIAKLELWTFEEK